MTYSTACRAIFSAWRLSILSLLATLAAPGAVAISVAATPAPSLSVFPTFIEVSSATNFGGPTLPRVIFTVDHPDATAYYYRISYEGTALEYVEPSGEISAIYNTTNPLLRGQQLGYAIGGTVNGSMGTFGSIDFLGLVSAQMQGAGHYQDTLKIWVCYDPACTRTVSGSPRSVPVSYVVTGAVIPDSSITVYGHVAVEVPSNQTTATASVTIEAENLPTYGAYVFARQKPDELVTAAKFINQIGPGLATQYFGTVELTLENPSAIGAGIRSESFNLDVCFDAACKKPATGSPFQVDVKYVVDPVEGKEYIEKRIEVIPGGMVWDSKSQRIYAVLPVYSPNYPNTLARINPFTATVEKTVPLDGMPELGTLAVSDDGEFLYMAVSGPQSADQIERVRTSDMGIDLTISLPPDEVDFVAMVKPAPNDSHLLLVGIAQTDPELYLYHDATQVGVGLQGTLSGVLSSYTWGGSDGAMYGYLPGINATLQTGAVTSKGIKITHSTTSAALEAFNVSGDIRYIDGVIIWDGGATFDPTSGLPAAPFDFFASSMANDPFGSSPAFDPAGDRAYFVTDDQPYSDNPYVSTIEAFTLKTRAPRWLVRFPVLNLPSQLLRWGPDGLAFFDNSGSGSLVLISGSLVTQ